MRVACGYSAVLADGYASQLDALPLKGGFTVRTEAMEGIAGKGGLSPPHRL